MEQLRAGSLPSRTRLRLTGGLSEFPRELLALAPTLEALDLSGHQLDRLPAEFSTFRSLRVLFLSENRFECLPEVLGSCPQLEMVGFKNNQIHTAPAAAFPPNLRWLILTGNRLEQLPRALGERERLQKLMLSGNRLRTLPESLESHPRLELLRIAANRLENLPHWLFSLPRLAWLATSGNPGSRRPVVPAGTTFASDRIRPGELLGKGASGSTFAGMLDQTDSVAIKVFSGANTSDGDPRDEMALSLLAGIHPQLAGVRGRVADPGGGPGSLVMNRLPSDVSALGKPPDFATCTRDTFDSGASLSRPVAHRILREAAQAQLHLLSRGIAHGDFYAHNLLVDPMGRTFLTDFGAANHFEPGSGSDRGRWENLEARAFGCLIDDLSSLLEDGLPPVWQTLRDACLGGISTRPSAREWAEILDSPLLDG